MEVTRRLIAMYPTEKIVSASVASRNAAGAPYPAPITATGTLNSIAVMGAAPVTMQKMTPGSPSAPEASRCGVSDADGAAGATPSCTAIGWPLSMFRHVGHVASCESEY